MTIYAHLKNGRPTIGVLACSVSSAFQDNLVAGANAYAQQQQINLIAFAGGPFLNPDPIAVMRDQIFELANTDLLDGLLIPMGSMNRYISRDETREFLQRFNGIPVATVVSDVEGYMNVTVDNAVGMFELVQHLISKHGVERFAFARGHKDHLSSNEKMAAFLSVLQSQHIVFDQRRLLHSDLKKNALMPDLDALLAVDGEWPQAIITVNDNQAIAIIDHLKARNIRVPEDIIVTGCMAIEDGLFYSPSLTSISEPTYEMGWHATRLVHERLQGLAAPNNLVLPAHLVVRASCGCSAHLTGECAELASPIQASVSPLRLLDIWQDTLAQAPANLRDLIHPDFLLQLDTAFSSDVAGITRGQFMRLLAQQVNAYFKEDVIRLWGRLIQELLSVLQGMQLSDQVAALAQSLLVLLQESNEKAMIYRHYEADKYVGLMREIGIQLNSEFDVQMIAHLLARDLGVQDFYACTYDEQGDVRGSVTGVMAMRSGKTKVLSGQSYSALRLLPEDIEPYLEPYRFMVLPLSFQTTLLGYLVLDVGENKGITYESLVTLFSAAFENQRRLRELRIAEEKFSDIALSASDWLWEIDDQGCYSYSSDGVEEVMGLSASAILGQSLFDFLFPDNARYISKIRNQILSGHAFSEVECVMQHKYGQRRVLLASGTPIMRGGRVLGYRGAFKDVTQIKQNEEKIRHLAYRDALTDLPNRTLFNDRLTIAMAAAQRGSLEFAILFLDLDGFKLVNDSMGHNVGDQLLQVVARRLSECVRGVDTLARFGGDEFIIILPRIKNHDEVAHVAQRVVSAFSSPIEIHGQTLFITTSVGVTIYPQDGVDAVALLKNADKAMYQAKAQGKNRYVFYGSEMEEKDRRAVQIRHLLHTAIKNDGFYLVYQPQIEAKTGKVWGVEALLRLQSTEFGAVSPAEFIPLSEEVGLIDQIGLWVFRKACQQQRSWADEGVNLVSSINLSAKQLHDKQLFKQFSQIIQEYAIDPKSLVLEITEHAVIENESIARATLQQFSDLGIRIALDDFGTGYASLSILRQCHIDIVKIDRSFVNECTRNAEGVKMVSAIVQMAKSLEMLIVAEGVETQEQAALLRQMGCDEMQGYYYARPLAVEEIAPFVLQSHQAQ